MNDKKIKIEKSTDEIPVEDIRDILKVVNEEVPSLITGLFKALYSAETAEQYAKGIGTIYKTLSEQGLPEDMIEKLVLKYSDSINIVGNAMKNIDINKTSKDEDD